MLGKLAGAYLGEKMQAVIAALRALSWARESRRLHDAGSARWR